MIKKYFKNKCKALKWIFPQARDLTQFLKKFHKFDFPRKRCNENEKNKTEDHAKTTMNSKNNYETKNL